MKSQFFTKEQLSVDVSNGMKEKDIAIKYNCCEGTVAYHKEKWKILTKDLCPTNPTNRNRRITNCHICGNPITLRMKCRTCTKIIRRYAVKQVLINLLGGKCTKCGYDKCINALDFHHIDEKNFGIGNALHDANLTSVVQEVLKCELLCSNCHREHHFEYSKAAKDEYIELIEQYIQKNNLIDRINDISAA